MGMLERLSYPGQPTRPGRVWCREAYLELWLCIASLRGFRSREGHGMRVVHVPLTCVGTEHVACVCDRGGAGTVKERARLGLSVPLTDFICWYLT